MTREEGATIDEIVQGADNSLEDANRHQESFSAVWEAVSPYIATYLKRKAVIDLACAMDCADWADYLPEID